MNAAAEEKPLRRYTREVRVQLTPEEENDYGRRLADLIQEERLLDDKRKLVAKEYATAIAKNRTEQARLAEARSKGEELRAMEVYEIWNNGVIEIRRCDTDDVVDSRPATLADRQAPIPGLDTEPEEIPWLDEPAGSVGDAVLMDDQAMEATDKEFPSDVEGAAPSEGADEFDRAYEERKAQGEKATAKRKKAKKK